ncbi:membrane-associated protein, putative [Bodo saltans]|uniref:Membrane-associated protein, putative n=1 Tax=Bodo saltans TaxID=75058 RepID=A0A0S4IM63_BODSA|nr:membrane-associated protein, putative [Bodo saltans]|eukprot:CUE72903.1 membrane-associated protein, putative [Bodo saltans]
MRSDFFPTAIPFPSPFHIFPFLFDREICVLCPLPTSVFVTFACAIMFFHFSYDLCLVLQSVQAAEDTKKRSATKSHGDDKKLFPCHFFPHSNHITVIKKRFFFLLNL